MIKYLLVLLFIIFISCNAEKVINNKPIDNTPIENNSIDNNPIDNNPINDNPIDNKKNVNIKNLKITLNEQTYSIIDGATLPFASVNEKFGISFSLMDDDNEVISPHQVFIRMNHLDDIKENVFYIPLHDDIYQLNINMEKAYKDFIEGNYNVELIIGGVELKKPIRLNLGKVHFNTTTKKRKDDLYSPKKEIKHLFRKEEPRPSTTISRAVTGLIFVPLLFLFIGILIIGPNCQGFPIGLGSIYSILFHILIAAMLGVIVMYWIQFTIFQALAYLSILGIATTLIGSKALRAVNEKRMN